MRGLQVLILVMIINLFLFIGGLVEIDTTILGKSGVNINATGNNVTGLGSNSSIEGLFINSTSASVVTSDPFGIVSTLFLIWDYLMILMGFFFAPIWVLQSAKVPIYVTLLVGIPLVLIYVVSIISFIKGKDL